MFEWQAMSMMNMFAKSVRKLQLHSDDTATKTTPNNNNNKTSTGGVWSKSSNHSDTPADKPWGGGKDSVSLDAADKPWGGGAGGSDVADKPWGGGRGSDVDVADKPWGDASRGEAISKKKEEPWKRRALPRQQALLAKKLAAATLTRSSSRSSGGSVMESVCESVEDDLEGEQSEVEEVDLDLKLSSSRADSKDRGYGMDCSDLSGASELNAFRQSTAMDASRDNIAMDVSRDSADMDASRGSMDVSNMSSSVSKNATSVQATKNTPNRQKSLSKRRGTRRVSSRTSARRKGGTTPPSTRKALKAHLSNSERERQSKEVSSLDGDSIKCLDDESTQSQNQQQVMTLDLTSSALSEHDKFFRRQSNRSRSSSTSGSRTATADAVTSTKDEHDKKPEEETTEPKSDALLVGWSH